MFAISQAAGYLIVGVVTAIIPLGSAYLAVRANRETSRLTVAQQATGELIDDLRTDRTEVRSEVKELRDEIAELRVKLDECETERTKLTHRVGELERAS